MTELLAVAADAARAGGAVVSAAFRTGAFGVSEKSRADFVTEVDVAAERAIVAVVRAAFPDHAILTEEGTGSDGAGAAPYRWVVDPLDGTTNFIRGIPFVAVSVGVERRGVPVAGAVLDPVRGELFTAAHGAGAWCGAHRLRVSAQGNMGGSLVLTGIPFRNLTSMEAYMPGLDRVARASAGIRRMGSAALDLASIAEGRAEAFWEYGLSRWDLSAGVLLVQEAGGRVTDLRGGGTHLDTGHVLASNGLVHDAMLGLIGAPVE